VTLIFQAGKN